MKRSTKEVEAQMKKSKDYLLDRNAQEDEMETCDENCIINRRAMVKESCRTESQTRNKHQNKQTSRKTKKKMGRRDQRIP